MKRPNNLRGRWGKKRERENSRGGDPKTGALKRGKQKGVKKKGEVKVSSREAHLGKRGESRYKQSRRKKTYRRNNPGRTSSAGNGHDKGRDGGDPETFLKRDGRKQNELNKKKREKITKKGGGRSGKEKKNPRL